MRYDDTKKGSKIGRKKSFLDNLCTRRQDTFAPNIRIYPAGGYTSMQDTSMRDTGMQDGKLGAGKLGTGRWSVGMSGGGL